MFVLFIDLRILLVRLVVCGNKVLSQKILIAEIFATFCKGISPFFDWFFGARRFLS